MSPIEQASDFLHELVKSFNFDAFLVPEKIRNHVKSEALPTDGMESLSLNLSEVSESSENKKMPPGPKRKAINKIHPFKLASRWPPHDFMVELRDRISRQPIIPDIPNTGKESNADETKVNAALPGIQDRRADEQIQDVSLPLSIPQRRQRLISKVLIDDDDGVEAIPQVLSVDTMSTKTIIQRDATCNILKGCFNEATKLPKQYVSHEWHRGDFMTVDEAKNIMLASAKKRDQPKIIDLTLRPQMNSNGEEIINLAFSGDFSEGIDTAGSFSCEKGYADKNTNDEADDDS